MAINFSLLEEIIVVNTTVSNQVVTDCFSYLATIRHNYYNYSGPVSIIILHQVNGFYRDV